MGQTKWGDGKDVFEVQPWVTNDVTVTLRCTCGASYEVEIGDLLDISIDGQVHCECEEWIQIPSYIRLGWLI